LRFDSEPAPHAGAIAGAAVPGGGPEPGGGGAGGGKEGVRGEGQGQPPQGHRRRQGLPPAVQEHPQRARAVLVTTVPAASLNLLIMRLRTRRPA
jgi:hypothetical protein